MPRAFSSGALSIWSKADASLMFVYLSCSTLVIAAVSVVLPWSMCPMVPMLTCGFVRSNLALATEAPSSLFATLVCGALRGFYHVGGVLVRPNFCGRTVLGQTALPRSWGTRDHSPR